MSTATATIRELRTDFRAVKRKIEQHGEIIITDNGDPAYVMKPIAPLRTSKQARLPDYYARLLKRQPKAMSTEETRKFWDAERGNG
jgi:antitoxin (DNA-binding transcriptional repressor) of toxin-antitoxin stability system